MVDIYLCDNGPTAQEVFEELQWKEMPDNNTPAKPLVSMSGIAMFTGLLSNSNGSGRFFCSG